MGTESADESQQDAALLQTQPVDTEPLLSFVARVGTVFLTQTRDQPADDGPDLTRRLVAALQADARVTSAGTAEDQLPDFSGNTYPVFVFHDHGTASTGESGDLFVDLQIRGVRTIGFSIQTPKKNQPKKGQREVASETYFAVWDGYSLLVAWPLAGRDSLSDSGGHVAVEVMASAAASIGCEVRVQACTRRCDYQLNHTTMLCRVLDVVPEGVKFHGKDGRYLPVDLGSFEDENNLKSHSLALFSDLDRALMNFAMVKNISNHLDGLSRYAWVTADELLELERSRALISTQRWRQQVKARWRFRGWRHRAHVKVAELWLEINRLENQHRVWMRWRDEFESNANDREYLVLFEEDYRDEAADLERLDFDRLAAEAEYAANRLDNRALMMATAVGALAGAVGGTLAGLLT